MTPGEPTTAQALAAALKSGDPEAIRDAVERSPVDPIGRHRGIDGPGTPTPSLVSRLLGFCLAATADDSDNVHGDVDSANHWFDVLQLALERGFSPFHTHHDRHAVDIRHRGHAGAALVASLHDIHSWRDAKPLTWEMGSRLAVLLAAHGVHLDAAQSADPESPSWRAALMTFPPLHATVARLDAAVLAGGLPPAPAHGGSSRL